MLSTPVGYRMIASNLDLALKRVAERPDVQRESAYYLKEIRDVDTIDQFLADDRLYTYAMKAHGLEEMTYAKAFMRKVLTEGIDARDSFANSLADSRYREFAAVFNFARYGATATTFDRAQQGTVDNYVRQTLELGAGEENQGVRLALYFQRKAPSLETPFSLLADRALLKVTQVALGLSEATSALDIDRQAELISKKLEIGDLKDQEKLDRFLERFTALWDIENPPSTPTSASTIILSGGVGSMDVDLLTSIQNIKLGR